MKLRCDSITPRGFPVEPELKSSAARSSPPPREGASTARVAHSGSVATDAPWNETGPGWSSTTCVGRVSHLAHAAAIRVSTNANRIRVWSTMARQSPAVSPGETGTATQPARIEPR